MKGVKKMLFDLKGKLEHLKQEQDEEDFRGEKQDYKFSGLPFRMTRVFMETFKDEYLLLIWHAIIKINSIKGEKERIQVFIYDNKKFYAVSTWENGTKAEDYVNPEELSVVFMLPSDY